MGFIVVDRKKKNPKEINSYYIHNAKNYDQALFELLVLEMEDADPYKTLTLEQTLDIIIEKEEQYLIIEVNEDDFKDKEELLRD